MFIFFFSAAALKTRRDAAIVLVLICLSVLVVNRSYHGTMSGRDFSQFSYELRDAGPLGYAGENGMGAFQAEIIVFLIGLSAFVRRKAVRIALWAVALTSVYSLVLTFSRGGYAGFLIGVLVLGLIKERKLLLVLVVLLATWQGIVPNAVRERVFMTYEQGEGLDSSAEERVVIWEDALNVITHNPVLGAGFDTYEFMGRVGDYRDTHNYYLKVLLELGFVGLFVFFWLIASACRLSWELFRTAHDDLLSGIGCALFATLVCAAVVNFFGDRWSYIQVNGFLWVFMGIVARGLWLVKQESVSAESAAVRDQIRREVIGGALPV
jgi:O-antigen ligase